MTRLHSVLKAASSFTRNEDRLEVIVRYQEKQKNIRARVNQSKRQSLATAGKLLADRDSRIEELETQIEALVASHLAMIRVVGELGGMPKILVLFKEYS